MQQGRSRSRAEHPNGRLRLLACDVFLQCLDIIRKGVEPTSTGERRDDASARRTIRQSEQHREAGGTGCPGQGTRGGIDDRILAGALDRIVDRSRRIEEFDQDVLGAKPRQRFHHPAARFEETAGLPPEQYLAQRRDRTTTKRHGLEQALVGLVERHQAPDGAANIAVVCPAFLKPCAHFTGKWLLQLEVAFQGDRTAASRSSRAATIW